MSTFNVGDKVRVISTAYQKDQSLKVGDIGTVAEVLNEPKALIESLYGDKRPLFVHVEGKPCNAGGETNWSLLSDEVEHVEAA